MMAGFKWFINISLIKIPNSWGMGVWFLFPSHCWGRRPRRALGYTPSVSATVTLCWQNTGEDGGPSPGEMQPREAEEAGVPKLLDVQWLLSAGRMSGLEGRGTFCRRLRLCGSV